MLNIHDLFGLGPPLAYGTLLGSLLIAHGAATTITTGLTGLSETGRTGLYLLGLALLGAGPVWALGLDIGWIATAVAVLLPALIWAQLNGRLHGRIPGRIPGRFDHWSPRDPARFGPAPGQPLGQPGGPDTAPNDPALAGTAARIGPVVLTERARHGVQVVVLLVAALAAVLAPGWLP